MRTATTKAGVWGLFFAMQLVLAGVVVLPAKALPFKKNCAAMQAFLNAQANWGNNPRPKFADFDKQELISLENFNRCPGGYITTTTPMGTQVCKGYITYFVDGSFSWTAFASFNGDSQCRYR